MKVLIESIIIIFVVKKLSKTGIAAGICLLVMTIGFIVKIWPESVYLMYLLIIGVPIVMFIFELTLRRVNRR